MSAKVVAATGTRALKPERFGRYLLLDRIGSGGMAEVFRAVMPGAQGFRQTFVVKRILGERSRAADFVDMFVQEARIGALLSHPNIVQVFDFGNVGGDYFLAMEYLRGRDVQALMRKLRRENLLCPVPVAAFIAHEVAACLGYAHDLVGADGKRLNIVHRDVSPSNIMCLRTGGVKLLDFGIAKAAGEPAPRTPSRGCSRASSPTSRRSGSRTSRSTGASTCSGWASCCGRCWPAGGCSAARDELETLNNVMEMQVPPPSADRPDVPASLDAVVDAGARARPAQRYPTGQAMADDLEAVLRETGFHARMLVRSAARGVRIRRRRRARRRCPASRRRCWRRWPRTAVDRTERSRPRGNAAAMELATRDQHGRRGRGDARRWPGCCWRVAAAAARTRRYGPRRAPAVTAPAIDPIPPAAGAPAARPTAPPEPSAAEPGPASPTVEEASEEGAAQVEAIASPSRSRSRKAEAAPSPEDRVVRGLSVDPFAEAQRGAKP